MSLTGPDVLFLTVPERILTFSPHGTTEEVMRRFPCDTLDYNYRGTAQKAPLLRPGPLALLLSFLAAFSGQAWGAFLEAPPVLSSTLPLPTFSTPYDNIGPVAQDSSGMIYYNAMIESPDLQSYASLIYKYDRQNNLVTSWSIGFPCISLTVAGARIYVATLGDISSGPLILSEYTLNGALIATHQSISGYMQDCARAPDGTYYVLTFVDSIVHTDAAGIPIGGFRVPPLNCGGYCWNPAHAIAVSPAGEVVVMTSGTMPHYNVRIYKFSSSGVLLLDRVVGASSSGNPILHDFQDVAIDRAGRIYLSDGVTQGATVFDRNGYELPQAGWARVSNTIANLDVTRRFIALSDHCEIVTSGSIFRYNDTTRSGYYELHNVSRLNIDRDFDGLCDPWEIDGMDLGYGTAAFRPSPDSLNPDHKNIYVEVDAMTGCGPSQAVLGRVAAAFKNLPATQLQAGNPDGRDGITLVAQLDQANVARELWTSTQPGATWIAKMEWQYWNNFAQGGTSASRDAKRLLYRYCFFADSTSRGDGGATPRGSRWAMCSLGDRVRRPAAFSAPLDSIFAGAFMHELGHALGLLEGGGDDDNFKPNYHSVMNYLWQYPDPGLRSSWHLAYSPRRFNVMSEVSPNEAAGIGGTPGDSTYIGPWNFCPGQGMRAVKVPEHGALDLNCDGDTIDTNGPVRNLTRIDGAMTQTNVRPDGYQAILRPYADAELIRLTRLTADSLVVVGGAVPQEMPLRQLAAALSLTEDCNNNGIADGDEIAREPLFDRDGDWVLDQCEGSRIEIAQASGALCPGGDGDSVVINIDVGGLPLVNADDPHLSGCLVRTASSSAGMHLYPDHAYTGRDSLWSERYDVVGHKLHFALRRASGCGVLSLALVVDGRELLDGGLMTISLRTLDLDSKTVGGVDRFDQATLNDLFFAGASCGDVDGDGHVTSSDVGVLANHLGHSIERRVIEPNDGYMVWTTGTNIAVRWERGDGDSAKVEVNALCGPQRLRRVLAHGVPDTGYAVVPVVAGLDSFASCTIEVVHTAGTFVPGNGISVGADTSDAPSNVIDGIAPASSVVSGGLITNQSIAVTWTASGDDGATGRVSWVNLRYSSQPITASNFDGATAACCVDSIRVAGRTQTIVISGLLSSHFYYIALRCMDETNNVSPISNILCLATLASGGQWGMGEGQRRERGAAGAQSAATGGRRVAVDDEGRYGAVEFALARHADSVVVTVARCDADGNGSWVKWRRFGTVLVDSQFYACGADVDEVAYSGLPVNGLGVTSSGFCPVELASSVCVGGEGGDQKFALGRVLSALNGVIDLNNVTAALINLSYGDTLTGVYGPGGDEPDTRAWWLMGLAPVSRSGTSAKPVERETPIRPRRFALQPPRPNPATETVGLHFDVATDSDVDLSVFDLQGRCVRRILREPMAASSYDCLWDLRGNAGERVLPGCYLVRLKIVGGVAIVRKLIVGR